jgi:5-dehydro-4-deoxyglucarate dehydratase
MDYNYLRKKIRAVHIFTITPFKTSEGGPLDLEGVRRNVAYWASLEGTKVIAVCCGTGEFPSLTEEENRQIVEITAEETNGRCPIFSGIGGNTEKAARMAKAAQKAGGDVVLVMPEESILAGGEEAIFRHHATIAEEAEIGIVPYRNGNSLFSVDTILRLMEIPNVVALKDESGDIDWFRDMIVATKGRLPGITGGEMMAPYYYLAGGSGITSGMACLLFHHSLEQWEAGMAGDFDGTLAVRDGLAEITKFRGKTGGAFIKAGLELMGLAGGPVRADGAVMSIEDRKTLRRMLAELGAPVE